MSGKPQLTHRPGSHREKKTHSFTTSFQHLIKLTLLANDSCVTKTGKTQKINLLPLLVTLIQS